LIKGFIMHLVKRGRLHHLLKKVEVD